MRSTRPARSWATWTVVVGVLGALFVVAGPARPAFGCDCSTPSDAAAFEQSDAVFVGRVVDHQPPPGPGGSSAAPATWVFEVSEVYKGEVAFRQEVVSEVSGVSCGLEIPREGEFLVFATRDAFLVGVDEGQYYAGLCGGTRSTSAGPIGVEAAPVAPESAPETTVVEAAESERVAAPTLADGDPADRGESSTTTIVVVLGGALGSAVVIGVVLVLRRRSSPPAS